MRRLTLAILAGALTLGLAAGPVAAKQPDTSGSNIVDTAIALNSRRSPETGAAADDPPAPDEASSCGTA